MYDALKTEIASRGLERTHWITRTHCLGLCPKRGATIVHHPGAVVLADVEPEDVTAILLAADERAKRGQS